MLDESYVFLIWFGKNYFKRLYSSEGSFSEGDQILGIVLSFVSACHPNPPAIVGGGLFLETAESRLCDWFMAQCWDSGYERYTCLRMGSPHTTQGAERGFSLLSLSLLLLCFPAMSCCPFSMCHLTLDPANYGLNSLKNLSSFNLTSQQ